MEFMKKLLLHTCCAPCLTYVQKQLTARFAYNLPARPAGGQLTTYFYNPNIYPEGEFVKRYFVLKDYARKIKLPLIFEFDNQKTKPGDCGSCYEARLLKTAEYAKNNKMDAFTTTLLISPYQKHELLKEIGRGIGDRVGIEFFYHDFRDGYSESRTMSSELGLYRQKYCGCRASLETRSKKHDQVAAAAA